MMFLIEKSNGFAGVCAAIVAAHTLTSTAPLPLASAQSMEERQVSAAERLLCKIILVR